MATTLYRGFSTADWSTNRSFGSTEIELIKRDLMNHIFTSKGERVMMPNFGTRIPTLAFEPNDEATKKIVEEDLTAVFNYDPRVKLLKLTVLTLSSNNAILALADLLYVELNVTDVLNIEVPTS